MKEGASRTHHVKMLGSVNRPKKHAGMTIDNDSVSTVDMDDGGHAVLSLPVCIQEQIFS